MRELNALAMAAVMLVACASGEGGDGRGEVADEAAWLEASEPDVAAELELEGGTGADELGTDLVDDADDPAEMDEEPGDAIDTSALAKTYRNPLGPGCADPGIVRAEGAFWVACTGSGYPLFRSTDLVSWRAAGRIFTTKTKPKWAGGNYWAPEIHVVGDGLVAYYTALSPSRDKMCIGAARADNMAGPWRDIGRPLVCDASVSLIDATTYLDGATGKRYLYYKTDGNALSPQRKTILYGHELRADGLGFVGTRKALLRNTIAWEGDVVEAPWVVRRGGYYYMFYSGFRYCNATYGVGIARAKSPLGPFTKKSAPVLRTNAAWSGPGHNAVIRTGGKPYLVYHAWQGAHDCDDGGGRQLMLDAIGWEGGWPTINDGTPSRGAKPAPET